MSTPRAEPANSGREANVPRWALALGMACLSVYVVSTTLAMIVLTYEPIPFWDQWESVTVADCIGRLFLQHNEHRIVFSRLFFALDIAYFRGSNAVALVATCALQFGHASLLTWLAARGESRTWPLRITMAATVFGLFFSAVQWENFVWAFQIPFIAVFFATTSAFAVLAFGNGSRVSIAGTIVLMAVATFTIANGLAAAPLVVAMAILTRRSWGQIAVLTLAAVVLVGAYLHGYTSPPGHTSPVEAIRHPLALLRYVSTYVGGPFAPRDASNRLEVATALGACCLGANATLALLALRRPRAVAPSSWVFLFLSAFIIGSALLTSLGRLEFGIEQALASRYATPAIVLWSTTFVHALYLLDRRSRGVSLLIWGAAFVALGWTAAAQMRNRTAAVENSLGLEQAETALLSDADDVGSLARAYPDPAYVARRAHELRRNRSSLFAEPWAAWLGRPLRANVERIDSRSCLGAFDSIESLASAHPPAARVSGWAWSTVENTRPRHVVLTDDHGIVVGYAYTGVQRPDVIVARTEVTNVRVGWSGHVGRRASRYGEISAYALVEDERVACLLPGRHAPVTVPEGSMGTLGDVGAPLAMESPSIERGFAVGALPPDLPRTTFDSGALGSWLGSGGSMGTATWRGEVPAEATRIALPIAVGPGLASNLRIRTGNGVLSARLPRMQVTGTWVVWRIDLPPHSDPVQFVIEAEDVGDQATQWLVVGPPGLGVSPP